MLFWYESNLITWILHLLSCYLIHLSIIPTQFPTLRFFTYLHAHNHTHHHMEMVKLYQIMINMILQLWWWHINDISNYTCINILVFTWNYTFIIIYSPFHINLHIFHFVYSCTFTYHISHHCTYHVPHSHITLHFIHIYLLSCRDI